MQPIDRALRELMDVRGITEQTELAAAAEVTPATISRYLSRHRARRMNAQALATVEKLARALDVEPEYFLEYRQAKAKRLVEEAMAQGLIDLEDIELILARKRYQKRREGTDGDCDNA